MNCNHNCQQGRSCSCYDRAAIQFWEDIPTPEDVEGFALQAGQIALALFAALCVVVILYR